MPHCSSAGTATAASSTTSAASAPRRFRTSSSRPGRTRGSAPSIRRPAHDPHSAGHVHDPGARPSTAHDFHLDRARSGHEDLRRCDRAPDLDRRPSRRAPTPSSATSSGSMKGTFVVAVGAPPPPARCHVPRVVGLTVARARRKIRAAHCAVGRIRYTRSVRPRGKVVSQKPRAGRRLARAARVQLVVSRGRG